MFMYLFTFYCYRFNDFHPPMHKVVSQAEGTRPAHAYHGRAAKVQSNVMFSAAAISPSVAGESCSKIV